jgi:hypothetical protein
VKKGHVMRNWLIGITLLSAVALPACVTINIYFPAAAAEKATDKIIDDVWQLKNGEKSGEKPEVNTVDPAATPAK